MHEFNESQTTLIPLFFFPPLTFFIKSREELELVLRVSPEQRCPSTLFVYRARSLLLAHPARSTGLSFVCQTGCWTAGSRLNLSERCVIYRCAPTILALNCPPPPKKKGWCGRAQQAAPHVSCHIALHYLFTISNSIKGTK